MKKLLVICVLITTTGSFYQARAQHSGIKTNLLYDATATFNLGAEFRLGGKTSLDIPVNWNPFTFGNNRKWKHILVQPELRLWTRETFAGHFFGLHTHYAYYNVGNLPEPFSPYMRSHRFEGWLAGAGVSYGYRWNFSPHWGMEATVGAGYAYMKYDKFTCGRCGDKIASETKHYFGPTKIGLSLIYSLGTRKSTPDVVIIPPIVVVEEPVVVYVPQLAVSYMVPVAETVKWRSETGKSYLDFVIGKSDINPGFRGNTAELQKISSLIEEVRNDPNATITGIKITGYASPDGGYAANQVLSQNRATSLKKLIQAMYGFPESLFTVEGRGEDWTTLENLVSQSEMTEKGAILAIINSNDAPDVREKKLASLSNGELYRLMNAQMFPELRRTEYELGYTVAPFTLEKSIEVFKVKPSLLSLNEMFRIANTYPVGSDGFNEVCETAARLFPLDDTANLNAAASALNRGDAAMGSAFLSKVKEHTPEYHNNMGVLHGLLGQWDKAVEEFRQSRSAGNDAAVRNLVEIARKVENIEAVKRSGSI